MAICHDVTIGWNKKAWTATNLPKLRALLTQLRNRKTTEEIIAEKIFKQTRESRQISLVDRNIFETVIATTARFAFFTVFTIMDSVG